MKVNYLEIVETIAQYEVECAKAQLMFEIQTGIKIDKMTDFLLKFIYLEDLHDRQVTMTILANTLMTNENTIRKKLKQLIKYDLIEICKCGCDGRQKQIVPTDVLKGLMIEDATAKLKTMESISENFKNAFGEMFAAFYKEFGLEKQKSFTEHDSHNFYQVQDYKYMKNIYKNTRRKLG